MAAPCACWSPCQNSSFTNKNELAEATLIEGSGTSTPTPAVSYILTPYSAIKMAGTCACNNP